LTADAYYGQHDTFEPSILERINNMHKAHLGSAHVLQLLDKFKHEGPHGDHLCLVFKAMGPNLADYRRFFPMRRIPIPALKQITRQLLLALSFLHTTCKIIHTGKVGPAPWTLWSHQCKWLIGAYLDIKPQNILLETTQINEVFEHASPAIFAPLPSATDPRHDFYMKSGRIISTNEDPASVPPPPGFSARIADFGTGEF
jgi:serine/threonine-protein kinase SRPK3